MDKRRSPWLAESWFVPVNPKERRVAARYPASDGPARFGWWSGSDFRECAALLLDISLHGALAAVDEVPIEDKGLVWVRLDGASPTEWVEARMVLIQRTRLGPHEVGLRFSSTCPYEFFKAAVYGHHAQPAP